MSNYLIYIGIVLMLSMIVTTQTITGGSCRGSCCPGKNSSCYSVNVFNNKRCYCDSDCSRSRDCCRDYLNVCQSESPVNCVLSNWQLWSQCSQKCGQGYQKRSRKILIPPNRHGRRCGHLSESRTCQGVLCPAQRSQGHKKKKNNFFWKASIPVVQILPDNRRVSTLYRQYSHKYGIRRHMYLRDLWLNNATDVDNKKTPYCNYYQITMSLGKCQRLHKLTTIERANWIEHAMYLTKYKTICVTCYPQNQLTNRCAGSEYRESRWRAVRSDNCHGFFKFILKKEQCKCPPPAFMMI